MKLPEVSVIIPTCGRLNYLERSIKSILYQTYPNVKEIIITDDSNDSKEVLNVIKKFNNSKIKHIKNSKYPKGPATNKQNGIDISEGELFALLDDDDILYPDAIEFLVDFFIKTEKKYDIVFANCIRTDNQEFSGKHYGINEEVRYKDILCGKYQGEYFGINKSWVGKKHKPHLELNEMESITGLKLWKEYDIKAFYLHRAVRVYTIHKGQITANYEIDKSKTIKTFKSYELFLSNYGPDLKRYCLKRFLYLTKLTSYLARISGRYFYSLKYAFKSLVYGKDVVSLLFFLFVLIPFPSVVYFYIKRFKKIIWKK